MRRGLPVRVSAGRGWRADAGTTRGPRLTLWLTMIIILVFVGWAYVSEIDQITRVQGQVITSSRTQVIQASDGGVIKQFAVHEGDTVDEGQTLIYFEPSRMEAAYQETNAKVGALSTMVDRLRAEVLGGYPEFSRDSAGHPEFRRNQLALLSKRRASIEQEVASLNRSLNLAQRELDMTLPLLKTGDVSMADIIRLERQVNEVQAQITNRRNKFFQDAQAELAKAEEDLTAVKQNIIQRSEQLKATQLKAPMRGIVKNLKFTTVGGVLRPGDELMQIVPLDEDLIVEVKVRPVDIAFVKRGLEANVKIDSYDYSIYGWLTGKISYVSADSIIENTREGEQTYYRTQIKIEEKRFSGRPSEKLDIQPGMTTSVEIKTGQNTVLQYLTKPIIKTWSQSLSER